jgi:hypothetical protein
VPGKAQDGAIGHDPTIPGWSWVDGTASWLEPTALAVLALRRAGRDDHPRARDGRRLILDRALPAGGWNYGNTTVFGTELRPQPGPTGLALLALAGPGDRPPAVARALRYLADELPTTRSALALGWGLMGLRAWGEWPDGASAWLAESSHRNLDRPDAAPRLAYLLLASSATTPSLLGLGPEVSS